jgi:hypothetical protein
MNEVTIFIAVLRINSKGSTVTLAAPSKQELNEKIIEEVESIYRGELESFEYSNSYDFINSDDEESSRENLIHLYKDFLDSNFSRTFEVISNEEIKITLDKKLNILEVETV